MISSINRSFITIVACSILEFGETAFHCEGESEIQVTHSTIKSTDLHKPIFILHSQGKLSLSEVDISSKSRIDFQRELDESTYFKIENSYWNNLKYLDFEKK